MTERVQPAEKRLRGRRRGTVFCLRKPSPSAVRDAEQLTVLVYCASRNDNAAARKDRAYFFITERMCLVFCVDDLLYLLLYLLGGLFNAGVLINSGDRAQKVVQGENTPAAL